MAAIIKRTEHDNPEKSGKLVEFYLGYQNGMDRTKTYTIPVKVNGYEYTAVFGKTNLLPEPVVKVLQNAKSAIHPTPQVRDMDRMRGGDGRPASQILQTGQEYQYIPDYEIVIQKEG